MEKYKLNITKEHCPMTFVKTKVQLSKMSPGDQVEVILREGEPLENVPRSAVELGHKILEQTEIEQGIYRIVIEK